MKVILAVDPIAPPLTGIGRYTWELAKRLPRIPGLEDVRYFHFGRWIHRPDELLTTTPVVFKARRQLAAWRPAVWVYSQVWQVVAWSSLRSYRDFLYHSPNFILPPFAGPSVTTFHDLSVIRYPEFHPRARVALVQREIQRSLRRADHVITVSHFVAAEIAEYLGFSDERISVVPNGVSEAYHPRATENLKTPLARYDLTPGSYSLCVSTIEPRKNISTLLNAYEQLPQDLRAQFPLVLCGDRGWRSEETHESIERAQQAGWLTYLGYVPENVLPILYAGAKTFVFPALYEGFGLPVLEAMASGIPVVTSNCASLPEVTQGCALLVEPSDAEALASAILQALQDNNWREAAVNCGLQIARKYTWEACAAKTADVYASLV